jgi:hypothetical protein
MTRALAGAGGSGAHADDIEHRLQAKKREKLG